MKKRMIFLLVSVILLYSVNYIEASATGELPSILLNGPETLFLEIGTPYVEYGAVSNDLEDGDITHLIVSSGVVDISTEGSYPVTYSVTDNDANSVSVTRNIIVYQPSGTYNFKNDTVYPWTENVVDEKNVIQSNNHDDLSTSVYTAVIVGPANLSFDWKVSSETSLLSFYIDDVKQALLPITTWENQSINLGSGIHTVKWEMKIDDAVSDLTDTAYLSNIIVSKETSGELLNDDLYLQGIEDTSIDVNESFDLYNGLAFYNAAGVLLTHVASIESPIDASVVGHHDIIYNINVTDGDMTYNIRLTRRVTVMPLINDLVDEGSYDGNITLNIIGGIIKINDIVYENGSVFNLPGTHKIQIAGINDYVLELDFTIQLLVTGIIDQGIYIGSVTPIFSGGTLLLDEKPYTSQSIIDEVGHHTITIKGSNDYVKTLNFTIVEEVDGIINNGIYLGSVTPTIHNAALKLDGMEYVSGTLINKIGHHTLEVYGVNEYYSKYQFTIKEKIIGFENDAFYKTPVTPIVENGEIVKVNDQLITNGEVVTDVGFYQLIVYGTNDYKSIYRFAIIPTVLNVENNKTYFSKVTPIVESTDVTLTLNDAPYESGTEIADAGVYTLLVNYKGYVDSYQFSIVSLPIKEGGIYYGEVKINLNNATLMLNDLKIDNGHVITEIGDYKLDIITSDYTKTVNFKVVPKVSNVEENKVYQKSTTPTVDVNQVIKLELNGKLFTSGTEILEVGHHTLTVYDTNNYIYDLHFTIKEEVTGIEDDAEYVSSVFASYENVWFSKLNGKEYTSGTLIKKAGKYSLVIYGINGYSNTIDFTIKGDTNIEDNKEYLGEVTPTSTNGVIYINGSLYTQALPFNEVGHHELKIVGENDYNLVKKFTILPIISGIKDQSQYVGSVKVNIEHVTLELNGEPFIYDTISQVGNHTLKIIGTGGYAQELSFTVIPDLNVLGIKDGGLYSNINLFSTFMTFSVDGETLRNSETYKKLGHHQLTIYGVNGYIETLKFTIIEKGYIKDDGVYDNMVIPMIDNGELKLNGDLIDNDDRITKIGHHELEIIGSNDYRKTINFTILYKSSVVNGKEYKEPVMIRKVDAKMMLDGVEITEDTLVGKHGKHTLTIIGTGGYTETIEFSYNNINYGRVLVLSVPFIILLGSTLYFIIGRKRVI